MSVPRIVVIGSLNQDLVARVDRMPRPGETITGHRLDIFAGGKGANQAVAAARLGAEVFMVGRVGEDAAGEQLQEGLRRDSIHVDFVQPTHGSTGRALITADSAGENTIVLLDGANAQLSPGDVLLAADVIASASIVLLQLEIPLATVRYAVELCAQLGRPVMLDPAPAQRLPRDLVQRVTWLTPNQTEAAALVGSDGEPERDLGVRLLASGPRNVVLKLGSSGCYLAGADTVSQSVAAFPVTAKDTTAAGDAFNGAFACALARGLLPQVAARYANAAAAVSATRMGAQPSMPTHTEVEEMLARGSLPNASTRQGS